MDTKALERIGLTKSEIAVYLALLKLGQTTAGKIVDEAKVTRSKIYDILERLKNKGLVSHIIRNATKYFSAASPKNILEYLNEKEKEIEQEKKAVIDILPLLLQQETLAQNSKIAEIFIGFRGLESAFTAMIKEFNSKDDYYAFGAGKGENIKQVQQFFTKLHKKRTENKITSWIIFNESSRGLFKSQEKSKYVKSRYLQHSTPTAINIYKDYVILAILTEEPITILIKKQEVANSFKEYFNTMWKQAKK
ncbi:hypothetical protein COV18_04455 [Candidatus Woesearchaeota archaeon CG10_big_fil_rev_8_21_14_0_10_37_12]|nr:MAG: hypothetical protein COV18_04455 [Candidatus Woesearchaeota archaeon CG10_big_fil_rev_8_21_14_0_10_37_12]